MRRNWLTWLAAGLLGVICLGGWMGERSDALPPHQRGYQTQEIQNGVLGYVYGDSAWQVVIVHGGPTRAEGDTVRAATNEYILIVGGYSPGDTAYSIRVDVDGRVYTMCDSLGVVTNVDHMDLLDDVTSVGLVDSVALLLRAHLLDDVTSVGLVDSLGLWLHGELLDDVTSVGLVDSMSLLVHAELLDDVTSVGLVDSVDLIVCLEDIDGITEANVETAISEWIAAFQETDEKVDAGSDSTHAVDVRPHHGGHSMDTTFTAAIDVWFTFKDRNWAAIRAEIVDVWARNCTDTVTAYGPFHEFHVILGDGESMHWERTMIDSVRHKTDGAGSVGHSGQGVAR